ncbi:Uncharacterised protein [Pragia fontium]|nr:Uncharacterised protein [Pragia fontium]
MKHLKTRETQVYKTTFTNKNKSKSNKIKLTHQ